MSPHERSLAKVTPERLAQLLSQTGLGEVSDDMIQQAMELGVPRNKDGTFHLVHFGAWLAQQLEEST